MGANSSDDHEQQLLVVGRADHDIDHQQQQHVVINTMVIRYKCSFCDRGFSNAQALGGHMNVHRRDRAAKIINNISSDHGSSSSTDHQSKLDLPWITTTKLDREYQVQETDGDIHERLVHHHKPSPQQQLPLFVDTVVLPSRLISSCKGTHEADDDLKLKEEHDHEEVTDTERELMKQQPSTSCSHGHDLANDDTKLDLELRLGPHEPDNSTGTMSTTTTTTSTTTGTRDFF